MFNRSKLGFLQKLLLVVDKKLLIVYFGFLVLSCIFIYSSSVSVANRISLGDYYFFKHQLYFSFLSIFIVLFLLIFDEEILKKYSIFLFVSSLILLILVPIMGFQTKGAKRWIYLFGISIQPTEILKPTLILINAYLLEKFVILKQPKYIITTVLLYLISIFFIYKQPDIGTLILITVIFFTQIFLIDSINLKKSMFIIFAFLSFFVIIYFTLPHVSNRINNFISSIKNPDSVNYQVKRSLIAYQNSGFFGKGFLEGEVKNFIPDVHTDFIFPAIAEEFGFLIVFLIISLYFYFTLRVLFKVMKIENNLFKVISLYGLSLLFLVQTVINIGVSLNLLPTKGMTLPFLSYGGSSMIGSSITIGFILILTKNNYDTSIKTENVLDLSSYNK